MNITVIDKQTGKVLSDAEVLAEINRDRSAEWIDYTLSDLHAPDAMDNAYIWIDLAYYDVCEVTA